MTCPFSLNYVSGHPLAVRKFPYCLPTTRVSNFIRFHFLRIMWSRRGTVRAFELSYLLSSFGYIEL